MDELKAIMITIKAIAANTISMKVIIAWRCGIISLDQTVIGLNFKTKML